MYITPERFKEMGFGSDVSELSDAELQSLCVQASAVVDSYCNVPRIPQKHDFRGGTITGEQHVWRVPYGPFELGQRKYYPFHWPITEVLDFKIKVTNTQWVSIQPEHVIINNSARYWEVVSLALTGVGLFNALVIPNIGLADPIAESGYTYGWDFLIVDESLTCSDGQTWRAQNQFWFTDAGREPIIKKNGIVEVGTYTIDATEGTVVFTDNLLATDTVTATYHHRLPTDIQFGTAHILAHLNDQAEIRARGMAGLSRLHVAEVDMVAQMLPNRAEVKSLAENLDILVPEASLLLGGYAADNLTVR